MSTHSPFFLSLCLLEQDEISTRSLEQPCGIAYLDNLSAAGVVFWVSGSWKSEHGGESTVGLCHMQGAKQPDPWGRSAEENIVRHSIVTRPSFLNKDNECA